ncbi:MAG: MBL fold metallo-hydrolase [Bacillota bacterium]
MYINDLVNAYGNRLFNIYTAGRKEKVLIECGVSGLVQSIAAQVGGTEEAGMVKSLVVMHAHFDHVCGLPGLRAVFPGAGTVSSARAAQILLNNKVMKGFYCEDRAMTGVLNPAMDDSGDNYRDREDWTIKIDRAIQGDEVWKLEGGVDVHFYMAPGHSPCSMMVYIPGEETLFSSDCAGFPVDEKRVFPTFFSSYEDYVQSMKKILEMPVSCLAPAHCDIIRGRSEVKKFVRNSLDWTEKTRSEVIEGAKRGLDREMLAKRIYDSFYKGNLRIYSGFNIMNCSSLIVRRSLEQII